MEEEDHTATAHIGMMMTSLTANFQHFAMLGKFREPIVIVDSGADTHIGGKHWLPLTPLEGPLVRRANVVGFDDDASKSGLPIIEAVTKVVLHSGETVLLRAKHLVYNNTSSHTLLSTYQLRDLGIVVDNIAKSHPKNDSGEMGGQCITFTDGKHIDLEILSALMTFKAQLPTMEEYEQSNLPIYDVAQPNWNPNHHYDDTSALQAIADVEEVDDETGLYYFDPLDKEQEVMGHCVQLDIDPYRANDAPIAPEPHDNGTGTVDEVDAILNDMDYYELTGQDQSFDTFVCAVSTVEKLHNLKHVQPKLA